MNRNLMRQAQQLQQRLLKAQEELEQLTVEATAGGGAVKVVVSGKLKLQSLQITPEAVDPQEVEMLQDLVLAAVNEGLQKAQDAASQKMSAITGGLKLPGM